MASVVCMTGDRDWYSSCLVRTTSPATDSIQSWHTRNTRRIVALAEITSCKSWVFHLPCPVNNNSHTRSNHCFVALAEITSCKSWVFHLPCPVNNNSHTRSTRRIVASAETTSGEGWVFHFPCPVNHKGHNQVKQSIKSQQLWQLLQAEHSWPGHPDEAENQAQQSEPKPVQQNIGELELCACNTAPMTSEHHHKHCPLQDTLQKTA